MHNRDILPLHIVYDNLADLRVLHEIAVPKEQQVAALKGRLHGAREHNDDGRGRVGDDGKAFPHHEGGGEDEGEVEDLGEGLSGVFDGAEHGGWFWRGVFLIVDSLDGIVKKQGKQRKL